MYTLCYCLNYKKIILPADWFRAEGSAWREVTLHVSGVTSDPSTMGSTKSKPKTYLIKLFFINDIYWQNRIYYYSRVRTLMSFKKL